MLPVPHSADLQKPLFNRCLYYMCKCFCTEDTLQLASIKGNNNNHFRTNNRVSRTNGLQVVDYS
jgi:hypothetical protein